MKNIIYFYEHVKDNVFTQFCWGVPICRGGSKSASRFGPGGGGSISASGFGLGGPNLLGHQHATKQDQLHVLDLKTCNLASDLKCLFNNHARERLGLLDN